VGFAGDAASTANSSDIEMNKQDAPARIEAKSGRPAHQAANFFPFEKIAARWIAFAHRLR
jgi:hypothetical protein